MTDLPPDQRERIKAEHRDAHEAATDVAAEMVERAQDRITANGPSKANGLDVAIVRNGRRILIDEHKFFAWLESKQPK